MVVMPVKVYSYIIRNHLVGLLADADAVGAAGDTLLVLWCHTTHASSAQVVAQQQQVMSLW